MKKQCKRARAVFVMAAVIGLTGMFSGTARADDDGWRHHERYEHQRYVREHYDHDARWRYQRPVEYRHYYYDRDGRLEVFYSPAPPVIVERPVAPSGFNIVIPLDLR